MTSEVALLNKAAVALAADSATTVTYWDGGEPKTRYFKGANKIFNISRCHPVGLMTYASANLAGVPWEILIKAYRDQLKDKAHDHLAGYATDLFEFIVNDHHLFPKDVQEKQFLSMVDRAAARIVLLGIRTEEYRNETDKTKKSDLVIAHIRETAKKIAISKYLGDVTEKEVKDTSGAHLDKAIELIKNDAFYPTVLDMAHAKELAEVAILGLYKRGHSPLDSTGLVLAGYGDKEYFPRLDSFRCHGLVLGKLICDKEKTIVIDQENASDYVTLAKTEMIETFIYGASMNALVEIDNHFAKHVTELEKKLRATAGVTLPDDISALKMDAKTEFGMDLLGYFNKSHQGPLRRVVSSLPIAELAELAETLIYMESLKERVTSPSESVSGPIDVAVISKSDGFIWVKRKHYFDPKLNQRYMNRL